LEEAPAEVNDFGRGLLF